MRSPVFLGFLVSVTLGANLYTAPEQLTSKEYDFIIAGGGTAGCVLASRLSENPNVSVLVVEAGGDNREVLGTIVPFLAAGLSKTAVDWNFTTSPQPGMANRQIMFQRGHVLGGSSSVNFMAYNRASNNFYDKWAKITDDPGWSWSSLEPYYMKHSRLVEPADGRDITNETIKSAHGYGPVEVSVSGYPVPLDSLVVDASKNMGGRFTFNQDINTGDTLGFTVTQFSIGDSRRSSAATAYLDPLFTSSRKNLDVLIYTQVTRLVQSDGSGDMPEFKTIEIATSGEAERFHINARKEILLSAGVVGTPHILQVSGIGPKTTLSKLGIKSIVNLQDVGLNLTDHPMSILYFKVNQPTTIDALIRNTTLFAQYLDEWNQTGKGPMVSSAGNTQAYLRLPDDSAILRTVIDPSSGPESGHIEFLFGEGMLPFTNIPMPESGNYIFALIVLVSPTSRGEVTFNSSDPFAIPSINPNYLATDFDKATIVQGVRDAFTFFGDPAFKDYLGNPYEAAYGPLAGLKTDEELLEYTQEHAITINHGCGTARMSPYEAEWGVVDPDLKLKGVKGVRVVDASVFPEIPEVHTMVPVYIIAERAADLIKKEHSISVHEGKDEL
ncbi:aryl-alcohol-oxidase from pleurotus Eryingii [Polyplosphaeria fusca]|uniref:Aryl-alcohol-oxidase from pleurotus Eryingii n=1 Tax=Polyplosphaeria fusca TaxID=682080 RepID=A0A9P4UZ10_9PLEO|nr:aryl-alcohol-oxidase from pleurotus Eryingii [Polyplosphaeria fusca]